MAYHAGLATTSSDDDWIEHDGGTCPVPPDTIVEIVGLQDEIISGSFQNRADNFKWSIVKWYRIVKPTQS